MVAIGLYYTYGDGLLAAAKTYVYKYINWEVAESALKSFCSGAGSLVMAAFDWIQKLFD
jgi:hypothetical protein